MNKKPKSKRSKKRIKLIRMLCTCGKRVKVSVKFAGKNGTCPKCGSAVPIPPLDVVQKMMRDAQKKKKAERDYDIPSLPSLKEIILDDSSEDTADLGGGMRLPQEVQDPGPQGTVELLLSPEVIREVTGQFPNVKHIEDPPLGTFDPNNSPLDTAWEDPNSSDLDEHFASASEVNDALGPISTWEDADPGSNESPVPAQENESPVPAQENESPVPAQEFEFNEGAFDDIHFADDPAAEEAQPAQAVEAK